MVVLGVVALIIAAVAIVFGLVVYGNAVGVVPDQPGSEPAATRKGMSRIGWRDLFARMKTATGGMLDEEASRQQRLSATGAFCVLVGLILLVLALLAFVAAAV